MTHEEAIKISTIISEADGGCSVCVENLLGDLIKGFPDINWHDAFISGASHDSYWKPQELWDKLQRNLSYELS